MLTWAVAYIAVHLKADLLGFHLLFAMVCDVMIVALICLVIGITTRG